MVEEQHCRVKHFRSILNDRVKHHGNTKERSLRVVDWSCRHALYVPRKRPDPLFVPTHVALLSGSVHDDEPLYVPVGLSSTMFGHYVSDLACILDRPVERAYPAVMNI